MNKYKHVFIVCPAYGKSGGSEALHQLSFVLGKKGQSNSIVYVNFETLEIVKCNAPLKFRWYNTKKSIHLKDVKGNLIIVPETMVQFLNKYNLASKSIWWLSVDYGKFNSEWLNQNIIHFAQSNYAFIFLIENKVANPMMLSDFIVVYNTKYFSAFLKRKQRILYDPRKFNIEMQNVIDSFKNQFTFKALINLDRLSIAYYTSTSIGYIDFGINPGKDRIPREVALNKGLIILNHLGAAGNDIDFSIPNKYKIKLESISLVQVYDLIHQYNTKEFDHFSTQIEKEFDIFNDEINAIFGTSGKVRRNLIELSKCLFYDVELFIIRLFQKFKNK